MMQATRTAARQLVYELFQAGLAAVDGQRCVADYLSRNPRHRPVSLVAVGKAACAMTRGALEVLDRQIVNGLVITKTGHGDEQLARDPRLRCIEAGHPLPNRDSLLAGETLCQFLQADADASGLLFLISGGASSLVEVLPDDLQLQQLLRANQWLMGSGLPIDDINRVRQTLSLIKGGGLLAHVKGRPTTVLLISDVPDDDPGIIGSGLLVPAEGLPQTASLPEWLRSPASRPIPDRHLPDTVQHHIIATNKMALQAAADKGRALGYAVRVMEGPLTGDAQRAGQAIASQLQRLPEGIYLWGGETTVTLPAISGTGGRNQHLALSAAQALPAHADTVILAAGTDGTDGPTDYSGAIVDAGTLERGQQNGVDAGSCLQQADSGRYLAATGDLLQTGPTGTNVMDMVIAYKGNCESLGEAAFRENS
jgi:glycerate 2-kinase